MSHDFQAVLINGTVGSGKTTVAGNLGLTLTNLRTVTANYRRAGARVLIMAGVIETAEQRRQHAEAVAGPLAVVRLKASLDLIRACTAGTRTTRRGWTGACAGRASWTRSWTGRRSTT